MKKYISVFIAFLFIFAISSCSSSKTAEQKAAEKRISILQDSISNIHAIDALNDGNFILLADKISFRYSGAAQIAVFNETNFIYVVDDEGVVQFALNSGYSGPNGLGGITSKGKVTKKTITTDKSGNTYVHFVIYGSRFNSSVDITLYKGSSQAQARVSSNYSAANMTFYGKILPYHGNN